MRLRTRHGAQLLLGCALLAVSCGGDGGASRPADRPASLEGRTPEPEDATERGGWTAGIVEVQRPSVEVATLTAVRSAAQEGFDRVVMEFIEGTPPGYRVEYIDEPVRDCGSGSAVPLAGEGWLEVRLEPARAHDDEGAPTIAEGRLAPGLPVVRELARTCDFEAVVTWVIGASGPNPYRVLELGGPPRLVIDVRH